MRTNEIKEISEKQLELNKLLREEDELKKKVWDIRNNIEIIMEKLRPDKDELFYPRVVEEFKK